MWGEGGGGATEVVGFFDNHSYKVISQMMTERVIDNRGSKSTIVRTLPRNISVLILSVVKEQRVYGSWQEKYTLLLSRCSYSCLRYILMDFERNSQIKILSKSSSIQKIETRRNYSLNIISLKEQQSSKISKLKLNPWFVTGFIDGEGCFTVTIRRNPRSSGVHYWIETRFSIGLHKKDLPLLIDIQDYFDGVGNIVEDKKKDRVEFRVSSSKELITNIFPHLDKYCLKTQKYGDYLLLKKIIEKKIKKILIYKKL